MIVLLAANFIEKKLRANVANVDIEIWKTIQSDYFYRALFLLLCSGLLIVTLVILLRRVLRKPKAPAGVEFSMVKQTKSLQLKSAVAFLALLSFLFAVISIFHLTVALLLQVDLKQDLSVEQKVGAIVQSKKTLVGRVLFLDHSFFFDTEQAITVPPVIGDKYELTYLKNSHIITCFQKIP